MKRILSALLAVMFAVTLVSCGEKTTDVAATAVADPVLKNYDGTLTMKYVKALGGGIESRITSALSGSDYEYIDFQDFFEKPREKVTVQEQTFLENMRKNQLNPDNATLMQKAVTPRDISKYCDGSMKTVSGFVTVCADSKSLDNVYKLYYGLRLDYDGSKFDVSDSSIGVIRFYADNPDKCEVLKQNNGEEFDHPNCLAGFTSAIKQNIAQPAWYFTENAAIHDKAELYEIFADGSEILRAVYDKSLDRFIRVDF